VSNSNDVIRIVSANFEYGGLGLDGGKDRCHTMTALPESHASPRSVSSFRGHMNLATTRRQGNEKRQSGRQRNRVLEQRASPVVKTQRDTGTGVSIRQTSHWNFMEGEAAA
jgi:hypothetical protein